MMNVRARKFIGVWLMIGLLVAYPILAAIVYANLLFGAATWLALGYFAVAGLLWAVPAGLIIRWMVRPDPEE